MKRITNFEFNAAQFLVSFPFFMGIGISSIIKQAESDIWLVVILGTIIGLGITYIIKKLPSTENPLLSTIYSFIALFIANLLITKLVTSLYLSFTPNIAVMLPGLLLVSYAAIKGKETIFRSSIFLLVMFLILFIFSALTLTPAIKIDHFLPLLTKPVKNILSASLNFAIFSTTPLLILPNIKEKLNYKTYLLSCLTLFFIIICTYGNLGNEIAKIYRYPEYMVFKKISVLNIIENIENILFSIWIIAIFELNSFAILKIKNNYGNIGILISLILIIITSNKYIYDNNVTLNFILKNYLYLILSIFIIYILSKLFSKKRNSV